MEKVWIYDTEPRDSYESKMHRILLKLTKNQELADHGAKNLGLYRFLETTKFSNADDVYNSVFLDVEKKKHYFTQQNAEKIYKFFNDPTIGGGDETASAYDKIINRWFQFVYHLSPSNIQGILDTVHTYAFPLRSIEDQNLVPGAGELLGLSIDVATQMNKQIAKMLQQYTPIMFGLLPLPESSTIGLVVGYLVSTLFIFFNMAILVSRDHLGEAFTQSLALIPFAGIALENAAESGNKILEKVSQRRRKLIDQIKGGPLPGFGNFLDMVIFDPEYNGDPKADAEAWKSKIAEHSDNLKNSFKELKDSVSNPEFRQQLKDKIQSQVETLKTSEGRAALQTTLKSRFQAGKRFSKSQRERSKWATQRRSVK